MIRKIDWDDASRQDEEGYNVYYETENPLFDYLPQYHFERSDMCEVFDCDFEDWLSEHKEECHSDFLFTSRDDELYIIHFPSGTIVNWYKHMGRTNTCNKNLTLDDLREFKKMLLEAFGYEEVSDEM